MYHITKCILHLERSTIFFLKFERFFPGSYDDGASEANLHQTFEMHREELLKCEET